MKNLFWFLLLIFVPLKFQEIATDDVIKKEFKSNTQLLEQYPNKKLPPEKRQAFYKEIKESSSKVRKAIIQSFFALATVILCAIILAKLLKSLCPAIPEQFIDALRLTSISLIFWSVWGKLGLEIQTYAGDTLPEIININWTKTLYLSGVFLAVMSYFLS